MKTKVVVVVLALFGTFAFLQVSAEEAAEARDASSESKENEKDEENVGGKDGEGAGIGVPNLGASGVVKEVDPNPPVAKQANQGPNPQNHLDVVNRFFVCISSRACDYAWGRCKSSCGTHERLIWNGCQGLGCVCCAPIGCTMLQDCKDKWGTCRTWCEKGESELKGGCIGGGNCKCCYKPKPVEQCKIKPNCYAEDGVCRSTGCLAHEKDIPWGCEGKGCWCCAPKEQKCELLGKCSLQKGTCKKECDPKLETYVHKGCYGVGCKCCVPKDQKCIISEKCLNRGGECKEWCKDTEKEVPYGCDPGKKGSKEECKCCAPRKCVRNKKCGRYKGKCKKRCDGYYEFEVPGGCYGIAKKTCKCCSKKEGCHMTKQCRRYGGWCEKEACGKNEVVVEGGCLGYVDPKNPKSKCNCCAPAYKAAEIAANNDFSDYNDYTYYDTP